MQITVQRSFRVPQEQSQKFLITPLICLDFQILCFHSFLILCRLVKLLIGKSTKYHRKDLRVTFLAKPGLKIQGRATNVLQDALC